jgi:hypothetical protein
LSFSVPTFNLVCNIYSNSAPPPVGPPRLTSPCNLAYGRRVSVAWAATAFTGPWMTLLLPPGTDIRSGLGPSPPDYVEVPAGSGRTYIVNGVDDVGKGFSNEHRFAVISGENATGFWPEPYP